jgi:hypothetical protein
MNIIQIPWTGYQSNIWWNNVCADVVEHFGLPGNKYTTEVSENAMKFCFRDEKDALMCRLLVSEYV